MEANSLIIKFIIDLSSFEYENKGLLDFKIAGVIFHRYLPNGKDDSITINKDNFKLDFWFERHGVQNRGDDKFIVYKYNKKEFNEEDIAKQGFLDAGVLFGQLELFDVPKEDLNDLFLKKLTEDKYVKLGKKAIKIIEEYSEKLIDMFKYQYGQYWLRSYYKWNSKQHSIGLHYDSWLNAKYFIPELDIWVDFIPNEPKSEPFTIKYNAINENDFDCYISETEWRNIKMNFNEDFIATDSLKILQDSHLSFEKKEYSKAVIEINISVELAVKEFFQRLNKKSKQIHHYTDKLQKLETIDVFTNICIINNLCTPEELEQCVLLIKKRNRIIHDGDIFNVEECKNEFYTLSSVVSRLMHYDKVFTPTFPNFNVFGNLKK